MWAGRCLYRRPRSPVSAGSASTRWRQGWRQRTRVGLLRCSSSPFAIITTALVPGAFAERMKFSALLLFAALWSLLCMRRWLTGRGAGRPLARRGVLIMRAARLYISMPAWPGWRAPCSSGRRPVLPAGDDAHNLARPWPAPRCCGSAGWANAGFGAGGGQSRWHGDTRHQWRQLRPRCRGWRQSG